MVTHNTVTATNAAVELHAAAALDALRKIAEHGGQLGKLVRDDWRIYGQHLLAKRNELGDNDKAFGQWVKDNGLDASPAHNPVTRSNAMWVARHWTEITGFYLSAESKDNDHHPNNIRQACRAAGMVWALVPKVEKKPPVKGWIGAVHPLLSDAAQRFLLSRANMTINAAKKAEVQAEYGQPIPFLIKDEQTVARLVAAIEKCAMRHNQDAASGRLDEETAALDAEVRTLPEKMQEKVERLVEKQLKVQEQTIVIEIERRVTIELDKRMADERRRIANVDASAVVTLQRANDRMREAEQRMKTFDAWMTQEEFKIVLGCLHPDRQPEAQRPKYDRAFQIFKRLEQHLSPNARALKVNGWKT